jgi:two-component system response regulator HydG
VKVFTQNLLCKYMGKILILSSSRAIPQKIKETLENNGHHCLISKSVKEAKTEKSLDAIICDMEDQHLMPEIKQVKKTFAETPIIVSAHSRNVKQVVKVMKTRGVKDYLSKPFSGEEIVDSVNRVLEVAESKSEFVSGVGEGAKNLEKHLDLISPTDLSIVIYGETGTGKEYVAREIHNRSLRSEGPFVTIDCGALTDELSGSTFFGHEKGAFTGAHSARKGSFELAHGGTLFLDEIENLSYQNQVKLLRAIQEGEVKRVGGSVPIKVDVRIIVATNQPLQKVIKSGKFRKDLYYRINEFGLNLEPLRERPEDLEVFANYFLKRSVEKMKKPVTGISPEAFEILSGYHFPGNLRELSNLIRRGVLLTARGEIGPEVFPESVSNPTWWENNEEAGPQTLAQAVKKAEVKAIKRAIKSARGNKSKAAEMLGVDRKTFYNKLNKHGLK